MTLLADVIAHNAASEMKIVRVSSCSGLPVENMEPPVARGHRVADWEVLHIRRRLFPAELENLSVAVERHL